MDKLLFKRLHKEAQLPRRVKEGDAGYDLASVEYKIVEIGGKELIDLGLSVAIPEGHYGRIAPRSGLAVNNGIQVGAGVVDASYRGPVKVLLFNMGRDAFHVEPKMRIAQLIIEKIATPEPEWAAELPETVRGDGGFGSSGQ